MPVRKCSNSKFRVGEGKCVFPTKKSAERAQKAIKANQARSRKTK